MVVLVKFLFHNILFYIFLCILLSDLLSEICTAIQLVYVLAFCAKVSKFYVNSAEFIALLLNNSYTPFNYSDRENFFESLTPKTKILTINLHFKMQNKKKQKTKKCAIS